MPAHRAARARPYGAVAAAQFSAEDSDSDMDPNSPPFLTPSLASTSAFSLFPTAFSAPTSSNILHTSPSALRKQACTNCRRRKRRCDLAKPSCGQCASSSSGGGGAIRCTFAPVPEDVNNKLREQKRARRARLAAEYILLGASAAVGIGIAGGGSAHDGSGGREMSAGGEISRANSLIGGVDVGGLPRTGHRCTPRASFAADLAAGTGLPGLAPLQMETDDTPTPTVTNATPSVLAAAFPNTLYQSLESYSIQGGPPPPSLLHLAFYPASPSPDPADTEEEDFSTPPPASVESRRGGVSAGGSDMSMAFYPYASTVLTNTDSSVVVTSFHSPSTGETHFSPISYMPRSSSHHAPAHTPSFDSSLFSPASAPATLHSVPDRSFRPYPLSLSTCSPIQSQSQLPLRSPAMSSISASSPDSLASVCTEAGGSNSSTGTGSAIQTPGLQWRSPASANGGYISLPSVLMQPGKVSSASTEMTAQPMQHAFNPTTYFSCSEFKSDGDQALDFSGSLRSSFDHAFSVTIGSNNNSKNISTSSSGYFDYGRSDQAQWHSSPFKRSDSGDGDLGLLV